MTGSSQISNYENYWQTHIRSHICDVKFHTKRKKDITSKASTFLYVLAILNYI